MASPHNVRNLFETSESASASNTFIANLALQRTKLTELRGLDKSLSPAIRLPVLREAIKAALEAIDIALVESRKIHETPANRIRGLEWKHWLKHNAWTTGSFAVMLDELRQIDLHDSMNEGLIETILLNERMIEDIKLTTVDTVSSQSQKADFVRHAADLDRVMKRVKSRIERRVPASDNTLNKLLKHLSGHCQCVMSDIFSFADVQVEYAYASEKYCELSSAVATLCAYPEVIDDEALVFIQEKWKQLQSLNPNGDFNRYLVRSVESSIQLCHDFEKKHYLEKICKRIRDAIEAARASLSNIREIRRSFSWSSIYACFMASLKTITWPIMAPILGITDVIYETQYLEAYNACIMSAFEDKPWTMTFMTVGLLAGIAVSGYYLIVPIAVSSMIPAVHMVGIGALGVAGGMGYYIRDCQLAKEEIDTMGQMQILDKDEKRLVAEFKRKHRDPENKLMHEENKRKADRLKQFFASDSPLEQPLLLDAPIRPLALSPSSVDDVLSPVPQPPLPPQAAATAFTSSHVTSPITASEPESEMDNSWVSLFKEMSAEDIAAMTTEFSTNLEHCQSELQSLKNSRAESDAQFNANLYYQQLICVSLFWENN